MGKFKKWFKLNEGVIRTARGKVWTHSSINKTFFRDLIDYHYGAKFIFLDGKWHMFKGTSLHEDVYTALTGKDIDYYTTEGARTYANLCPISVEADLNHDDTFIVMCGGGTLSRHNYDASIKKFLRDLKGRIFSSNHKIKTLPW